MNGQRPKRMIGVGFRRWKQANLAPILRSQCDALHFVPNVEAARRLAPTAGDALFWWSAAPPAGVADLAAESAVPTIRIEDGFYRSVGLGSDLIPPLSLVLDRQGIYFDPRTPSDLETILQTADFSDEELALADEARALIVRHGLTKYNLEPRAAACWPTQGRKVILVTGQVEDDASIRFGCTGVRTNLGLLQAARAEAPDAFIVYKPHPDVMSGNRKGRLALTEARHHADHIETHLSVISCIDACDEIRVMTSQAGFDALLRDKKVVTYGQPFYAGWGLTDDRAKDGAAFHRRTRRLTLNELAAGALIRYPLYWDPDAQSPDDALSVLRRLTQTRDALEQAGTLEDLRSKFWQRQARKIRTLIRSVATYRRP